jgi:hypothetical protein
MPLLEELMPIEEESVEKILVRMLDGQDVELKTEYHDPLRVSLLETLADWLEAEGLISSAQLVRDFLSHYSIAMVSNDRKSREEIVRAVSELRKQTVHNRWTGAEMEVPVK